MTGINLQPEGSRRDGTESLSNSIFLLSPNGSINESTRSLLGDSNRTAQRPFQQSPKPREPWAYRSKQPPPISQERDVIVDFMGYEHKPVSKYVVCYVPVKPTLGWGEERFRLEKRLVVTLGDKIWDWIDWLWMRRRNCRVCVKIIRGLRTKSASRTMWEKGVEVGVTRDLLPSVRSCGFCAVLYGALSPADQKRVDEHRKLGLSTGPTTFVCTVRWRGREVDVSLELQHDLGTWPLKNPLKAEVKLMRRSGNCTCSILLHNLTS